MKPRALNCWGCLSMPGAELLTVLYVHRLQVECHRIYSNSIGPRPAGHYSRTSRAALTLFSRFSILIFITTSTSSNTMYICII